MKKTTIDRIIRNADNKKDTVIGSYTYRFDFNTGEISRCKTDEIGKMWFDHNGEMADGWEAVAKI